MILLVILKYNYLKEKYNYSPKMSLIVIVVLSICVKEKQLTKEREVVGNGSDELI